MIIEIEIIVIIKIVVMTAIISTLKNLQAQDNFELQLIASLYDLYTFFKH